MDDLRERLEAVERALTDGDGDLTALAEGAAAAERVEALEADVADLQEEVAELSAATQALRGYVGNVRSVNESVEERADAALAAAESLEARIDATDVTRRSAAERDPPSGPAAADGGDRQANHGATAGADAARREDEPEQCRTCGRPTGRTSPADGGGEHGLATAGRRGDAAPGSHTQAGADATREPIDGFDPADAGPRVTVRAEPNARESGSHEAPRDADQTAGLAGRVRKLL